MELTSNNIFLSPQQAIQLETKLNLDNLLGKKWNKLGDVLCSWKIEPTIKQNKSMIYKISKEQSDWILKHIENDSMVKPYQLEIIDEDDMVDVKELIEENKILQKQIFDYSKLIKSAKISIRMNEKVIYQNCNHQWKRDWDCAFDDKCKYQCNKCGLWRNDYMYR